LFDNFGDPFGFLFGQHFQVVDHDVDRRAGWWQIVVFQQWHHRHARGGGGSFARQRRGAVGASPSGAAAVVPLLENYDLPPAGSAVDVMVDHLKVLAGKEPERVAEVVKQWVQKKHGRTEQ
jgi:hypothetical protein